VFDFEPELRSRRGSPSASFLSFYAIIDGLHFGNI
jgi:hypothetical protein